MITATRPEPKPAPLSDCGPAEIVGERGAQRPGDHVGEPEGEDRVQPEPPPGHGRDRDDEDEQEHRRQVAQAEDAGGEIAEGGAEREGGEHHGPVVALPPAGDDAVNRQRALAAVPEPEHPRQHHRPQHRGRRVRQAEGQVQGVGYAGAEDRDRVGQEPVGGGGVAAGPELPDQPDDQQAHLHDGADQLAAEGQVVRGRLAAGGGEELDHPEQQGDLRHLGGDRLRKNCADGLPAHPPRPLRQSRPYAPAGPGPHPTRAAIQRASPLHHQTACGTVCRGPPPAGPP